ncbi:hypothetical protein GCM10025298_22590 [Natronobiforma cellulositropha]
MKGTIPGETEEGIGVDVIDNNGAKHEITIRKEDNEIVYHQCEAYTDKAADRTDEENEHNNQARRFARYYVYRERGYDTLSWEEHPDRLNTVRLALERLPLPEFERLFGDFYQQLSSQFDASVEPVVEIPADAEDPSEILYRKDIFLAVDGAQAAGLERATDLAEAYDIDLTQVPDRSANSWQGFTEAVEADPEIDFGGSLEIGAVSDLGLFYLDDNWDEHVVEGASPLERDPDARVELLPVELSSLERCQAFLAHHLKCQVRDCFIGMGVEPPAPFRVLGPGRLNVRTVSHARGGRLSGSESSYEPPPSSTT